jgi:hypothetical protein
MLPSDMAWYQYQPEILREIAKLDIMSQSSQYNIRQFKQLPGFCGDGCPSWR